MVQNYKIILIPKTNNYGSKLQIILIPKLIIMVYGYHGNQNNLDTHNPDTQKMCGSRSRTSD